MSHKYFTTNCETQSLELKRRHLEDLRRLHAQAIKTGKDTLIAALAALIDKHSGGAQ